MNVAQSVKPPRRFDRDVDGILLLDKPRGLSSNAALQQARVLFHARKAGHAGSLDPLATGMLPICFGEATKVCGFLLDSRKTYRFTARLGQRTDTGDAEGQAIEAAPIPPLTEDAVRAVLNGYLGEQTQIPPMYSALKHHGERLYDLARRGETVARPERKIFIERLTLLRLAADELEAEVRCSKGTYVRTLAEDLAAKLGTVAHLTALRRIQVDPFAARPMVALSELADKEQPALESLLIPLDAALADLTALQLDSRQAHAIAHGQPIAVAHAVPLAARGELLRLYGPEQRFLGIGQVDSQGEVWPKRLLANESSQQRSSQQR